MRIRKTICTAKKSCRYRASTMSMIASTTACGTARRGSPGTQVSTLMACMKDAQKRTPMSGSTTIWLCIQTRTPHT